MMILPRQARDKHRENSKKGPFCCSWGEDCSHLVAPSHPDIVLACECIVPRLYPIEPLVAAIADLSGPSTVTFVAYEHRERAFSPQKKFAELAEDRCVYREDYALPAYTRISLCLHGFGLQFEFKSPTRSYQDRLTTAFSACESGSCVSIMSELWWYVLYRGLHVRSVTQEEMDPVYRADDIEIWRVTRSSGDAEDSEAETARLQRLEQLQQPEPEPEPEPGPEPEPELASLASAGEASAWVVEEQQVAAAGLAIGAAAGFTLSKEMKSCGAKNASF
jgi:hypothetical protein